MATKKHRLAVALGRKAVYTITRPGKKPHKADLQEALRVIQEVGGFAKNPLAVALGQRGGKARLTTMTAAERRAVAKRASQARWAKRTPQEAK